MRLIFDSHVHVYPFYDIPALFTALACKLAELDPDARKMAFLTDIQVGKAFEELCTVGVPGMTLKQVDTHCLAIKDGMGRELFLFNGRQIVTAERLEILALVCSIDVEGRLPAVDVVKQIHAAGGVAVIAWGVGKWLGSRGDVVRGLIDNDSLKPLLLGDSSMRPSFWGTPDQMEYGRNKGLKIICGSDPLPFRGEEGVAGAYATLAEYDFDFSNPSVSAREMLISPSVRFNPMGERSSPVKWLARVLR